jgi:hypothetical protein
MNKNTLHLDEPFSSEEKNKTRKEDFKLVRELSEDIHRELDYFGLPSPWMRDVAEWINYIDNVTAVELDDHFIPDLVDKAYSLGILERFTYLTGDVDKMLQRGVDNEGREIQKYFPFEVINLDYCSGLLYEGFDRIEALEGVFVNQEESILETKFYFPYFLLFITHNSHFSSGKQSPYEDYIDYLKSNINVMGEESKSKLDRIVDWYKSEFCPPEYRHKVFVIGKSLEFANSYGFGLDVVGITSYKGDAGTPMMHHQFKISPDNLESPIPPEKGIEFLDILQWPVENIEGDDIAGNDRPNLEIED